MLIQFAIQVEYTFFEARRKKWQGSEIKVIKVNFRVIFVECENLTNIFSVVWRTKDTEGQIVSHM